MNYIFCNNKEGSITASNLSKSHHGCKIVIISQRNNMELKGESLLNIILVGRMPLRAGKIRDGEFMSQLPEQLPAFPLHFAPLGFCLNKEMMLERQTAS